jgi:hypothetical protein
MKRGDIIARKSDPVHRGVITRIEILHGKINVKWLGTNIHEFLIPIAELELAEEWKNGESDIHPLAKFARRCDPFGTY